MVARPGAAAACFLLRMLPSPGQQQQQSMPEATTSFTPTLGDSSDEKLGMRCLGMVRLLGIEPTATA